LGAYYQFLSICTEVKLAAKDGWAIMAQIKGVSWFISSTMHRLRNKNITMNKKKKINQIHQKRLKAAKAKGNVKKKGSYISKAERAKLATSIETDSEDSAVNTDELLSKAVVIAS
jgi:hypothetical protein